MARTRNIKPGFFLNEELAGLGPYAQILFAGLWCMADREGRLEDRPKRIKAQCLPYDDDIKQAFDVDDLLTKLSEGRDPFITRYEVDGSRLIQINKWHDHQSPHPKEAQSLLPPVPSPKRKPFKRQACGKHEPCINDASTMHLGKEGKEGIGKECKEEEGKERVDARPPFERFWSEVPSRVGKQSAKKAYDLAVRVIAKRPPEGGPGADDPNGFLLERMKAFAASPLASSRYCPHPATWLNAGRYDDDPRTWQRGDNRNDPRGTLSAAQQYLAGADDA